MSNLTLEEKVGQIFMFGYPGKDPEPARELVQDLKAGGIIYFARNTGTVEEVAEVSSILQRWAAERGAAIPLFISADQEGGIVARLTEGLPVMPGPMSLAAADGPDLVEEVSRATATQLRAAGINMNLAPVLDVNDNPDNPVIGVRSFGEDPERVASLGCAAVRGLLSGGVVPVGKHFPGHGNTSVDSHLDLPLLPHPRERLDRVELVPFRAAVSAGIPAIMSAHVVFQAIDPSQPATLSAPVLRGLLREEFGFNGIIMTDCLEMNAIAKYPGTVRGAVLAFKAGCDMLLISHTRDLQKRAYEAVLEAVRSGEITEERLEESVQRILALKRTMNLPNPLSPEMARLPELEELSKRAHLGSITLVRNRDNRVPLTSGAILIISTKPRKVLQVEDAPLPGTPAAGVSTWQEIPKTFLGLSLKKHLPSLSVREIFMEEPGALEKAFSWSRDSHATIILTQNANRSPEQAGFVRAFISQDPGAILVATRDPYDIELVPDIGTYICTYSPRPEAMEALAQVLLGRHIPTGRLPVTIPALK
ncbi:MAG TPA: beta-N-acetylhexosaminidase [Firmicutes bacterium]|nr:beta-N-acetylhexosaminidase [Candidatus Fermentithermobacillaceae bacterium]